MTEKTLNQYCKKFNIIVPFKEISTENLSANTITDYYTISGSYYTRFHSTEGALHLPVAFSEHASHQEKLRFHANTLSHSIKQHHYRKVLELGCGMGFNTKHLAEKHPQTDFSGIDITENNIAAACKNSRNLKNVHYKLGNFDSSIDIKGSYDLIFAVETLCYSQDIEALIKRLHKHLNPGGSLHIFDGHMRPTGSLKSPTEKEAYRYLSWGFAIKRFQNTEELLTKDVLQLYTLEQHKDLSKEILPNFLAFQSGAKKVLRHPRTLKLLVKLKIISIVFIKQLAAGIFGPYFTQEGLLSYQHIVLTSKQ